MVSIKRKAGRRVSLQDQNLSLSLFEEFSLMMTRLCLGLFEKDLGHRFGISESMVSTIFRQRSSSTP